MHSFICERNGANRLEEREREQIMLAWLKRNKREMGCGCVELTVMSGDEEEAKTYNIV